MAHEGLTDKWAKCIEDECSLPDGSERPHINLLLDSLPWKEERRWLRRHEDHINVLEQRALAALLKERVRRRQRGKFSFILDSRVTLCAGSKGRPSSKILSRRWRGTLPILLGGRLHPSYHLGPTRKNTTDPPSRQRPVRPPQCPVPRFWTDVAAGGFRSWDSWCNVAACGRVAGHGLRLSLLLLDDMFLFVAQC